MHAVQIVSGLTLHRLWVILWQFFSNAPQFFIKKIESMAQKASLNFRYLQRFCATANFPSDMNLLFACIACLFFALIPLSQTFLGLSRAIFEKVEKASSKHAGEDLDKI